MAGLAAGCQGNDSYAPFRLLPVTQFVLRTARGNALPVIAFSDETRTTQIVADTITLRNDGGGIRRTRFLRRQGVPAVDSLFTVDVPLVYKLDGSKIMLEWGCFVIDRCLAVFTPSYLSGQVTRSGIWFDKGDGTGAGRLVPLAYDKQF